MSVGEIPQTEKDLIPWAQEIVEECGVSIQDRQTEAKNLRQAFYTGTIDEAYPSKHNKCYALVDTKASYLFSPSDVKLRVTFDLDDDVAWKQKAAKASHKLTTSLSSAGVEMAVSQAVEMALVEKSCFIKLGCKMSGGGEGKVPNFDRFTPHIVRQPFIGVLREDITNLDDQDAFTHTYYVTPRELRRLLWQNPKRDELVERAMMVADRRASEELGQESFFYELILGGVAGGAAPLSLSSTPSGARGAIPNLLNPMPSPALAANVMSKLIRVVELWVWNDEQDDYTTIRYIDPDIILEGSKRHRNLCDAPGHHPFIKVCPNETVGYFFGRSELSNVITLQSVINKRMQDIDAIFHRSANPPKAFIGFSSITPEKQLAMMSDCAHVFMDEPQGKVEDISPKMPENYMQYMALLDNNFEEAAGLNGMLQGKGEAGVRSGAQASQMLRTSTPRLRDQAFAVEGQVANLGHLALKIMQAKNAKVQLTAKGEQFLFAQLPDDATVAVDSHTSSPAFSNDNINLAFALARANAISPVALIKMTHPPNEDELVREATERQEQQQKLMEEAKQADPQAFFKAIEGGRKK